jgi:hypothetical protein
LLQIKISSGRRQIFSSAADAEDFDTINPFLKIDALEHIAYKNMCGLSVCFDRFGARPAYKSPAHLTVKASSERN